jgi:hypothetical protein
VELHDRAGRYEAIVEVRMRRMELRGEFSVKTIEAPDMWTPLLLGVFSILQGDGVAPPQGPRGRAEAILDRASKEPDLDGAALILSSLLPDGAALQVALSSPAALDERSIYILFGGVWGSRADVAPKDRRVWRRIRDTSVVICRAIWPGVASLFGRDSATLSVTSSQLLTR